MLRDSVFEQDHINVVMKVLFLPTRWFLPFQFAGNKSADTFEAPASLCKSRITTWTDLDVSDSEQALEDRCYRCGERRRITQARRPR